MNKSTLKETKLYDDIDRKKCIPLKTEKDSHDQTVRQNGEKRFVITVVSRQTENSIIHIHCRSTWHCLQ